LIYFGLAFFQAVVVFLGLIVFSSKFNHSCLQLLDTSVLNFIGLSPRLEVSVDSSVHGIYSFQLLLQLLERIRSLLLVLDLALQVKVLSSTLF
jgi:hypothetical protein